MDLTSFTSSSKKKTITEEIIIDNDEVLIKKIGDDLEFFLEKKKL